MTAKGEQERPAAEEAGECLAGDAAALPLTASGQEPEAAAASGHGDGPGAHMLPRRPPQHKGLQVLFRCPRMLFCHGSTRMVAHVGRIFT